MSDQSVVSTEQSPYILAPTQPQQSLNTDHLRDALILAGHDVTAVWEKVVAFAKIAEGDLAANIKKSLDYLGHSAVKVFDESLLLSKLK